MTAVGLDTCCLHGLSRVRQGMARPFLPRRRAPGKAGDFPKHSVACGFPSWSLERAEASVETAKGWAARSGPAPFLPLQWGGTDDSGTWDKVGFRRRWPGWGTAEGLPWLCPGRAMVGIGHQPFPVAPMGPSWDVSVHLSPPSAHGIQSPASPRAGHQQHYWGQHGTCVPSATRSIPGLRGREGSQPMSATSATAHGCRSHPGPWVPFPSWSQWQPCLHVFPHPAAGDPALSCPAGRPSRSHSTMSLSVRPQRRVLVTKINRSQSFAGVNSTADRPFR